MSTIGRFLLAMMPVIVVTASVAFAADPKQNPADYTTAIERLNEAIKYEVAAKRLPSFSIAIVDDKHQIWAGGFGFQDAEYSVPATAATIYRVGSVSKLLTDIAVMQLVEQGSMDLDSPIQKYLPQFSPKTSSAIPISLRHLMSHRSGLVREPPVGNYFEPSEPTLNETVASLNRTSLVYEPETKTKYSNAAVAVVGAALESQLDISHPQQVKQKILDPLGMNDSSFVAAPALEPRLATGWMHTYDGRRFEAPEFLLGTGPAGNLYSSVDDLSKFIVCLLNDAKHSGGSILQSETLKLMTTPIKVADGASEAFGLGFHVHKLDGYTKIGHGGAIYGFSTQLEALPRRKLGVVASTSLDGSNGVVGRLVDYSLRLMIAAQDGKPLPVYRETVPVPPSRAKKLVGRYRSANDQTVTQISELNGQLFMQHGPRRHELRSAADNGEILTDDVSSFGAVVKLTRDNHLLVGDTSYQRLEDKPPPESPVRWKALIGEYGWDHNTLYVLEENERLFVLIEWFYYYPLTEINENVFEFPESGLYQGERLTFVRDEIGEVTSVVAAGVQFVRRNVGTKDGETFKIVPVKPIDELRSVALAAVPPKEVGEFREADWSELVTIDPSIKLDIRYATTNNFTGAVFYTQSRAFLQRPAAEAVARANLELRDDGLGLLVHDAYRPWHVTKMFWDATPEPLRIFVANPENGSRHNRGCAVDLTLYDLQSGMPIQMVAGYDEFSPRSFPMYPGGTSRQRWYRQHLREAMEAQGFTVFENEWWHFDYEDWKTYRIGNVAFQQIPTPPMPQPDLKQD